jgi:hypothetical protein
MIFFQNAIHHPHGPVHITTGERAVSGDNQGGLSFSAGAGEKVKYLGTDL